MIRSQTPAAPAPAFRRVECVVFSTFLVLCNASSALFFHAQTGSPHQIFLGKIRQNQHPAVFTGTSLSALKESERLTEYHKRNYTWPIKEYKPNTPGWRSLFERRFEQLSRVENIQDRYNGWLTAITSAVVLDNFTEYGWGLTRAPNALVAELKESLHSGLRENRTCLEHPIEIIESRGETADGQAVRPLFIDQPELNDKVLRELQPIHSSWCSTPLRPALAYGLRLYRNQSTLLMHCDKPNTHVIASILHIDHSEDSEPWPLVLEDYMGRTHEVVMESGDLLLYESSKVYHGRPRTFNGSWYCSIFTHYYPEGWDTVNQHWESHYAVPPHWFESSSESGEEGKDTLEVVGTAVKEPNCEGGWSALKNSVRWYGPAKEGVIMPSSHKHGHN